MSRRFAGKAIVVTGAGSGIGRAAAAAFASEGGRVLLADRNGAAADAAAAEIRATGAEAIAMAVDICDYAQCAAMVARAVEAFGRLDIAFNNAGIPGSLSKKVHEYALDEWETMIRTNLTGTFHCMKAEVPAMIAGGGGAIVNTASVAGLVGGPAISSYVAAKHGVVGLTRAAAVDLVRDGIRVNAVCPGAIRTGMLEPALELPQIRALLESSPIGRVGEADEVARLVLFLASDEASFMIGAAVPVDGGVIAV